MRLCIRSARSGTSLLSAEGQGPVLTLAPSGSVSPGACTFPAHARLQGALCCARSFFEVAGLCCGEGKASWPRGGGVLSPASCLPLLAAVPSGRVMSLGRAGLGGQLHCPQPGRSQKVRG